MSSRASHLACDPVTTLSLCHFGRRLQNGKVAGSSLYYSARAWSVVRSYTLQARLLRELLVCGLLASNFGMILGWLLSPVGMGRADMADISDSQAQACECCWSIYRAMFFGLSEAMT